MTQVVDVDDADTWPAEVTSYADGWAQRLRRRTRAAPGDLAVPIEEADDFRRLFQGHLLRAIHCTRLLDHERQWIVERGLRLASTELIEERIQGAFAVGAVTAVERDMLLSGHALAPHRRGQGSRKGQVCFIGSRAMLDRDPGGVVPLLSTWGGEVIYMPLLRRDRAPLCSIGRPALVIGALDVAAEPEPPRKHHCYPDLNKLFVAKRLGLTVGADIFYRSSLPRENVLGIEHPGDPGYDRHRGLPST